MNYIGSKYSLLPFLDECISKVTDKDTSSKVFCDLFSGTATVGKHFKKKGFQIIANDLQYYSYILCQQYIGNHKALYFSGIEKEINDNRTSLFASEAMNNVCQYLNSIKDVEGFIYNNFCKGKHKDNEEYRLYFSDENGLKCDAIRQKIESWHNENKITKNEYYFLLATLIENIDKVANTASVYGAFLKKIKTSAQKTLTMQPAEMIYNDIEHQVYNEDANTLIRKITTDILYLDPPYNQRQYSANYHVLETIARYDNPVLKGKTGMRDYSDQKSSYCNKRKVKETFDDLIMHADTKYIFLSYNNEGLMSFEEIKDIMSKRGEYGCFEKQYNRFKADNASETRHIKANTTTEYLHYVICK
ncbi:MAG: DNA adenine methylase [Bacteroidales bacterium]|nr:DNA adenine methylase [Bacteroidales bacterium]